MRRSCGPRAVRSQGVTPRRSFVAPPSSLRPPTNVRRFATEAAPTKLTLNFAVPHKSFFKGRKVDRVTIPGVAGVMGIEVNHIPTIAQLKPGVVTITDAGKEEKFFLAAGFAIVNPDSNMTISAVEAMPLSDLDPAAARKGLEKFTADQARATSEIEKAKAGIGVELYQAMVAAL